MSSTGQNQGLMAEPLYLDWAATTPVLGEVQDEVMRYLSEEFGNAGSRTHVYGAAAKRRVQAAREQVAAVVDAEPDEVVFTSGATEANNLAILGLAPHLAGSSRTHVVTTAIEHKAVLEPVDELRRRGFDVTIVKPDGSGQVDPGEILSHIRPETGLVSVMHVNNETGVIQPVDDVAAALTDSSVWFHTDAAQGYGKDFARLSHRRVDLISASGHKIGAPKGVGLLVTRRRGYSRPPLTPLMFGGGQERGLRPGTLPVHLIAGLGVAAESSVRDHARNQRRCEETRAQVLSALAPLGAVVNGDAADVVAGILNVSIPGVDSEAAILATRDLCAIANGSACTSQSYTSSHVLQAMELGAERLACSLRLSWGSTTIIDDRLDQAVARLGALQSESVAA